MRALHALVLLPLLVSACSKREPPPNVVLVVIDTLRADHTSAYGYPRPTTPHLEALAEEGVLFEENWSQAPWTLPSMVSMLTGRYVLANYQTMPTSARPLAERLKDAGYSTGAIVANSLLFDGTGFERGFDQYRVAPVDKQRKKTLRAEEVLAEAEVLLGETLEEPFLAWIHLYDPHHPYIPPPPHAEVASGARPGMGAATYRERQPAFAKPTDDKEARRLEGVIDRYDGEVHHADAALGGIVEALRRRGVLERTLVIVTSDHGEGLFSHANYAPSKDAAHGLYADHGDHVYQESIRVPLVIRGPGFRSGERFPGLVENVDLYPTILSATGLEPDPAAAGVDLGRLGRDGKPAVFAFGTRDHTARTRTGLKLIQPAKAFRKDGRASVLHLQDPNAERPAKLFDLRSDPDERRSLLDERPADAEQLRAALEQWQEQHKDALGDSEPVTREMIERLRQFGYLR